MKGTTPFISALAMSVALVGAAAADEFDLAMAGEDWQRNRLLAPSEAQRAQEAEGAVIIYQGLRDVDVEQAMNEEFDRLEHMMFVDTVVTNADGEPAIDPDTGRVLTESDDC